MLLQFTLVGIQNLKFGPNEGTRCHNGMQTLLGLMSTESLLFHG